MSYSGAPASHMGMLSSMMNIGSAHNEKVTFRCRGYTQEFEPMLDDYGYSVQYLSLIMHLKHCWNKSKRWGWKW